MSRKRGRISEPRELALLTHQYTKILLGSYKSLLISLAFPVIASLITITIAGEDMFNTYEATKSGCFVLVSAAIWGGLFNSIQTVVKEREMVKRDIVSGGMRIRCYTFSRAVLQMLICAIQTAILCTAFLGVHMVYDNSLPEEGLLFSGPLMDYYLSLFLLMFAADAMGLMISCFVRKAETASVMAPYILIVQLIFSGILFELKGAGEYISYAMISRWGMEALGSISNCNDLPLTMIVENENLKDLIEREADDMFSYERAHLLHVWLILAAFSLFFILVGNLLLHRVKKDSRE